MGAAAQGTFGDERRSFPAAWEYDSTGKGIMSWGLTGTTVKHGLRPKRIRVVESTRNA